MERPTILGFITISLSIFVCMSRNDVSVVKGHLLYFSTNYSLTFQSSVYDRCIFSRFRFHADQSCRNRPEPFLPGAWRVAFSKSGRRGVVTLCLAVTSIDLHGATVWMGYNHLTLNPGSANLHPCPVLHTLAPSFPFGLYSAPFYVGCFFVSDYVLACAYS